MVELCPACDAPDVTISREVDSFPYGAGDSPVTLFAYVDMYSCGACGLQYTGVQGEIARAEAVSTWLEGGLILCVDEGCPQHGIVHYCSNGAHT